MTSDTPAPEASAEPADRPAPAGTSQIEHPELGTATAILDNRVRTRRDLWLSFASIAAGLLGVYFGYSDASAGDGTAWFWLTCGLILVAYGVALLRSVVLRMTRPVRLVLADAGFDYPGRPGGEPIDWREVAAADLEIPAKQDRPVGVCFQVREPEAFAARRGLHPRAAARLVSADGWISVRGETAMPLADVVALMRERIAAAKGAAASAAAATAAEKRRLKRTSRH